MSFAHNTPVQFIPGIGLRTAKILHGLGLHTAGQLNNVPEPMLVEVFGPSIRQVTKTLHAKREVEQKPTMKIEVQPKNEKKNIFGKIRTAAQVMSVL